MRLLFNWHYYHRADLTDPVMEASSGNEVFFIDRFEPDGFRRRGAKTLYWRDFDSPYALLDKVNPDKVIFSDIETFQNLALNIASRNRGIPTYILQHGNRSERQIVVDATSSLPRLGATSLKTALLLFRSLRLTNLRYGPDLLRFMIDRKRFNLIVALARNPFELRRPDFYIDLSEENARYFELRDKVNRNRITIIGNPAFDRLSSKIAGITPQPDRALLIDAPFFEAGGGKGQMPAGFRDTYIRKLATYFAARGQRLTVKLHPLSFDAHVPSIDGVDYAKDEDIGELAGRSSVIAHVHFSTLTAPLVVQRKFLAFSNGEFIDIPFLNPAKELHSLLEFDPERLGEPHDPLPLSQVERFAGPLDGHATDRLRKIFNTRSLDLA